MQCQWLSNPTNAYYHTTSIKTICACVEHTYGIGINNRTYGIDPSSSYDGFQCSGSSASNDDYDDEPLL